MIKNVNKLLATSLLVLVLLTSYLHLQKKEKEVCNFTWHIVDGDTLYINNEKLRIYGIDAPELHKQKLWVLNRTGIRNTTCLRYYGELSKKELQRIISSVRCVRIEYYGYDKYHRILAKVYACNASKCFDIGKYLVSSGLAISYGDSYKVEEESAKKRKIGLWKCS